MIAIAITDQQWFEFLRSEQYQGLVNFWTPTPWNPKELQSGDRVYFMLKSPIREIGGYGEFAWYRNMTLSRAWDEFGRGNGVNSRDELIASADGYVKKNSKLVDKIDLNSEIGCFALEHVVCWGKEGYMTPETYGASFGKQVVKYKYFDSDPFVLSSATSGPSEPPTDFESQAGRFSPRAVTTAKDRQGQPEFRAALLKNYDGKCCVTRETSEEVLEAAHIEPYVNRKSNHPRNGLLLRRDIHKLFDEGLLAVDGDGKVLVSSRVGPDSKYPQLAGTRVRLPVNPAFRPSLNTLAEHRRSKFRK